MRRTIMLAEQESAGNVDIAAVDQAAVQADEEIPMPLVDARQHVPRQARDAVMQHMQVVVEKEQAEERLFSTIAVRSS